MYFKLLIPLLFLLSACGTTNSPTFGPVDDDQFEQQFLHNIKEREQQILFYSRAIWYPNKNGFKFLPAGKKSRKGVIVCTNEGVYFSKWSTSKGYISEFNTRYDQIKVVRLAANELFGRVVIQKENYNSFEILGTQGPDLPNKNETEVLYKIIDQQLEN